MTVSDKRIVKVGSRLAKYIGTKATREQKLQAASMQVEFSLRDTLIMLSYLGRDPDEDVASKARRNLIPAARSWYTRPDRPELPEPIQEVVLKVIERVGLGEDEKASAELAGVVEGNIGLFGLGEMIQAVDHNNRTVCITLRRNGDATRVFTERGRVVGAVCGDQDGLEVLYQAFGWPDATFTYAHEPPGPFMNRIHANTLNLVMDALERAPEQDAYASDVSLAWKVQGNLQAMNIFEIAEIFEMNSKQALCRLIRDDEEEGIIFFNSGRVVNATLRNMNGMDAACHLLAWPSARFVVTRGGETVPEVIHIGMQNLIIEAMRLLDEGVTASDRIGSELELINELFEGQDIVTLPVLDRVRLVFGDDENVREILEEDANPVVRKAVKVKISKTVHKYLSVAAGQDVRLQAARGRVPLSTTEKLVLLTYLSHDESQEIRDEAKNTLASLDFSTFHKGFGSDLHPAVMDFLVREAVRQEGLIRTACAHENIREDTALHVLDNWKSREILQALVDNSKLLERSPAVTGKLYGLVLEDAVLKRRIDTFEASLLEGLGTVKVEGPLSMCGLSGLIGAARHGARSGTIHLQGLRQEGQVFFRRGKIIGALAGSLEGRPALEKLLKSGDPRFRYVLRTHYHVENIDHALVEDLLNTPAARPFHDQQARSGLRLVTGDPRAIDIFEILDAFEGTPVPVKLTWMCEEGKGEIYRDHSRVLHAHVDGKANPYLAMAAVMSWSEQRFMVRYADEEVPVTVDKPLGEFFTESLKEVDEEVKKVARPGELPEWELSEAEYQSLYHRILQMGVADRIKLAFLGSREAREILVRDPNKLIALAAVKSPKVQDTEIESISKSRAVCEDVLRQIASTKEWVKSYSVKVNLVGNSKTPVPIALNLLTHLREYDLRRIAKSKDVSSVVATQARRLADVKADRGT